MMSTSEDPVYVYGAALETIVALQLNWPPWIIRRGLNSRLTVILPLDIIVPRTTSPSPLEIGPFAPYHPTLTGLVISVGKRTVQTIVYICPAMVSPSLVVKTFIWSTGTVSKIKNYVKIKVCVWLWYNHCNYRFISYSVQKVVLTAPGYRMDL